MASDEPSAALVSLAEAYGISTSYWSFFGERVDVAAHTLRALLAGMGVAVRAEAEIESALAARLDEPWRDLLAPCTVVREHVGELLVHVADGHGVSLGIRLEDGSWRDLPIPAQQPEARVVDGGTVWRVRVPLPGDLPLGWHAVDALQRPHGADLVDRAATGTLVVTPGRLARPHARPGKNGRAWGLMAQLYSVRSRDSWGMGDLADLADLAAVAAARGADFLLVNPIHAAEVASPIEPSPYLPATRRFLAPLYVRPEDIRETAYLTAGDRALVARARAGIAASEADPARIDRDAVWAAKRAALEAIFAVPRSPARSAALAAFTAREGRALEDFALWCALEEHFAATLPSGEDRPAEAWDIRSPLVARLREVLAGPVRFHTWLQWIADEQARAAQTAAKGAGMTIGVMHDLAVGVHARGSDVWSLRDSYARGVTVGAPPDMYNQQGQDWSQPPWLPDALARASYAPLRDMIRTLLRHAGALRIDHILGLFRLWWIPEHAGPTAGAYVRYDHEAMIGVLVLEAQRAGAVVIGEDLGNVEPWVRDYLASRGVLGTSVLWFEHEDGAPKPPERYRDALLATVTTHDLPPTAGYLAGEHVELRARLGLLQEPVEQARAEAERERERMLGMLRERGLIDPQAGMGPGVPTAEDERRIVEALHVLLAASPSWLLGVALVDAVGERRAQNVPGTHREHPNWQIPLADAEGRTVLIEDLPHNQRFVSLAESVERALRGR